MALGMVLGRLGAASGGKRVKEWESDALLEGRDPFL